MLTRMIEIMSILDIVALLAQNHFAVYDCYGLPEAQALAPASAGTPLPLVAL